MIAALNAVGLDLATLGNHEFDFGDDVLIERMHEAKWQWVVSNVVDTRTGRPIGDAPPYVVKMFGALKVGFIGLCLNTAEISRDKLTHTRLDDPLESAAKYLPRLKDEDATVIVAVTHLAFATDRALVERFPEIDLIIGGHEHYLITSTENRTLISKAGTDARYVARIDVNRRPEGTLERFYELLPVTSTIADEPKTAEVVSSFEKRLGSELETVVGETRVPLDAVSVRLRSSERNVGGPSGGDCAKAVPKPKTDASNKPMVNNDAFFIFDSFSMVTETYRQYATMGFVDIPKITDSLHSLQPAPAKHER